MRKVLLTTALVVLGLAGAAYAATVVTNVYVVKATGTLQSGTLAHPRPAGATISYTVSTIPKGKRPNVVKQQVVTIEGTRLHTNAFPTCSTSKLNATGPSSCPKGSLVGTGFFIVEVGPASSQSGKQLTCRVDLSVFNGGGNSLSYYTYANTANKNECPSSSVQPLAVAAHVAEKKTTLVTTLKIPAVDRHPGNNTAVDAAVIQSQVKFPVKSRKIKGKTVGFAETILCPANHRRHVTIKFTLENGKSQTATANAACK
jgi:hypothetical protein